MKEFYNYLHDKYGIDANTSATLFVSIIVFVTGFVLTAIGRFLYSYQNKRSFQKSTEIILADFQKSCIKQSETIALSLQNASILSNKDFFINQVTISSLPYLYNLDLHFLLKNYTNPFLSKRKIYAISRVVAIVADIYTINNEIRESIIFFNNEVRRNQEEYTKNLNYLRRYDDQLSLKKHHGFSSEADMAYSIEFNNIFKSWQNAGASVKLSDTYNKLVVPVRELTPRYTMLPDAYVNHDISLQADKAFINLDKIEYILINKCETIIERHNTASLKIKRLIKSLKQKWLYYQIHRGKRKLRYSWNKYKTAFRNL